MAGNTEREKGNRKANRPVARAAVGARPIMLAVCGAGVCDSAVAALAEEVGREIAQAGATLVCGGLGGVMEAAARGAFTAGGLTVGILPGPEGEAANPWIAVALATNLGQARNAVIVQSADAVIAIAGEYGTLSEIALALKLGRPVVSLGSWEVSEDIIRAPDPAAAVRLALAAVLR